MWMHNGGIDCWKSVKRRLAASVKDEWFNNVHGSTDSEWAFALFLDSLDRMGYDPNSDDLNTNGFPHTALRKAMLKTIERINTLIAEVSGEHRAEDSRSLLNFALSDGHTVVCTRYINSKTDEPASLFFSSGTSWRKQKHVEGDGEGRVDYKMERRDKGADIVLVASEPLTFERDNWVTVPVNSILTIHKQTVMIHPIIDDYYSYDPSHARSSEYAKAKGQTTSSTNNKQSGGNVRSKNDSELED